MLRTSGLAVGLIAAALVFGGITQKTVRAQGVPAVGQGVPANTTASQRTGDVIVRFRPATALTAIAGALQRANATARASTAGSRLVLVRPAPGESVDAAVARLNAEPDVEFAEPDTTVHLTTTTPNDPLFATYQGGATGNLGQIGVPTAWDTTTGSSTITVGVLDTGVDGTQPDLSGRLVAGYNFVANTTNAADDHWHGTFVAAIIAGNTNNGAGIAGICWTCKIMPVKVLDSSGTGSMFDAAQGIDWAVAHGAKVINMSFGGSTSDTGLQTAIDNAWAAGVVLVAAAGNDNGGPVLYPAASNHVMAIASLAPDGTTRSSFSNVGPQLALSAPGEGIVSVLCNCGTSSGGYGQASGTSFASPEVAGVAALMIAAGTTSNATIVSTLESTATDVGAAGFDNNTGYGRLNAVQAVGPLYAVTWGANTIPTAATAGATLRLSVSFTNAGALAWPASGTNPVRFAYHWRNGSCPGSSSAVWDGVRTTLPTDTPPGATVSGLAATVGTPAAPGTYCLVYDLVREGVTWFSRAGAATQSATVTVSQPLYAVTWGSDSTPASLVSGSKNSVTISFMNSGSLTWNAGAPNPVRLSYHWRTGSCPGGGVTVWDGARTVLPGNVPSGASVTDLAASVVAPGSAGTYCLTYDLVREGVTWFSRQGATTKSMTVTVTAPVYGVTWGAQSTPSTMSAGSTNNASISFTNTGSLTWSASPPNPVRLAYHWRAGACPGGSIVVWDGVRTALTADVPPGGSVTALSATVIAPAAPGSYCLVYDLVREGVTWFSSQGAATLAVPVTVQ